MNKLLILVTLFSVSAISTLTASAEKYPDFCSSFKREIYRGDIGEDVRKLQEVLKKEGNPKVVASGFFGYETAQAVRKFQTQNGMYPFGKVGPDTYSKIKSLWCKYEPKVEIKTDLTLSLYPVSSNEEGVTVNWESKNALNCKLNEVSVESNGTKVFKVSRGLKLEIACDDVNKNNFKKEIFISPNQAIPPAPSLNASINPSALEIGQKAEINWQAENVDECAINGEKVATSGTKIVSAKTVNETFNVVCGTGSRAAGILLGAGNRGSEEGITSFKAERYGANIKAVCTGAAPAFSSSSKRLFGTQVKGSTPCEGNTYISWSTLNVKSCTISGDGFRDKEAINFGGENLNVTNYPMNFTLSCLKNDGVNVSKTLRVEPIPSGNVLLDASVTTDKSSYNVGDKITIKAEAKNNSGHDVYYYNSFPCVETSPFALQFEGKNYEDVFSVKKNVCTLTSGQQSFKTLKNGESIATSFETYVPTGMTNGSKTFRLVFANNLYGILMLAKETKFRVGEIPKTTPNTASEEGLNIFVKTDKVEYKKGDTMVVSVIHKNNSRFFSITYKKTVCDNYEGDILRANGVDLYDYFGYNPAPTCLTLKDEYITLSPGQEVVNKFRVVISLNKTYSTYPITLTVDTYSNVYQTDNQSAIIKINETERKVEISSGEKVFGKSTELSWLNNSDINGEGVLLEVVNMSSKTKKYEVVGTIAKVPDLGTYYTPSGSYTWKVEKKLANGVVLSKDTEYFVKASFYDNRNACFTDCPTGSTSPKILNESYSEMFKISDASAGLSSSGLQLVTKLEKSVKIKVTGELVNGVCESVKLNWGDGNIENLNMTKNATATSCESVSSHTYADNGEKKVTKVNTDGTVSELVVSVY